MENKKMYYISYIRKHGSPRARCWFDKKCYLRNLKKIAESKDLFLISYGAFYIQVNTFVLKEAMK